MNPYSSMHTKQADYGSAGLQARVFEPMTCRLLIISTAQLALLVLMPWAIFAALSWGLMSLTVYLHPWMRSVMIIATAALVVLTVVAALLSRGRWLRKGGESDHQPRLMRGYAWWAALSILSLIALVSGSLVGTTIFTKYMKAYYSIANLDSYDNVDPSRTAGKQLLDAGRIIFSKGSALELKHAMAWHGRQEQHVGSHCVLSCYVLAWSQACFCLFPTRADAAPCSSTPLSVLPRHQNSSMYCVAPIIAAADQPLPAAYDLWAAGKDCCADSGLNYTCGAAQVAGARGGLRLLNRDDDYNFRLAVQNAEFTHRLQAVHPLFFEWTVDPIHEIMLMKDEAFWMYFATNLLLLGMRCQGLQSQADMCMVLA